MCGIVAYLGPKNAYEIVIKGLQRLEYRGYDSSGVAIHNSESVNVYKQKGKVQDLIDYADEKDTEGNFLNNRILRVEIIESFDSTEFSEGAFIDYVYELDEGVLSSNLKPVIILLRNKSTSVRSFKVYQSSLSELFDEQILEWLNQPSNVALLPKGFLKLTFYPN